METDNSTFDQAVVIIVLFVGLCAYAFYVNDRANKIKNIIRKDIDVLTKKYHQTVTKDDYGNDQPPLTGSSS